MKLDHLTEEEAFVVKWQFRLHGDFFTQLALTFGYADHINKQKLIGAFPQLQGMWDYYYTEGWWLKVATKAEVEHLT